jgi:integrase
VPKLSTRKVAALATPGRYGDGDGLWLQVSGTGTKAWLLRYMLAGRARHMGLGPVSLVSLADARERAKEARRLLLDGIEPLEARIAQRQRAGIEAASSVTFRECAERYIRAHEAGWRNAKHRAQWKSTLASCVDPVFGHFPVSAIDTGLVLKALEPIWTSKPETAGRVRGRVEAVLDWAAARGYRRGENPARWRGHLDKLLPSRRKLQRVEHHAALPYAELPGFMVELRGHKGVAASALQFVILTAARSGEAIGAKWSEVDFAARIWTIPADRMKGRREHRVPLSDRAIDVLGALPREKDNDHVFIGSRSGTSLSDMALFVLLRRMGRGVTAHGFRSTFRDWAAEVTAYPNHVVEMALAHAVPNAVEAAYRRGDLFEKRRRLMADWAQFCSSAPTARGDVIPINAGRVS